MLIAPGTDKALLSVDDRGSGAWWWTFTPLHLGWAGEEAVLVFFVLSGFVLALPTVTTAVAWRSYLAKRLLRLYLPVWGSLLVAAALLVLVERGTPGASDYLQHRSQASLSDLPREAALLLDGERRLNGPLWSLRWEVIFSLLLPVYLFAARRFRTSLGMGVLVLFVIIGIGTVTGSVAARLLPVFGIGVLFALHQERLAAAARWVAATPRPSVVWAGLGVLCACLLTAQWTLAGSGLGHPLLEVVASASPYAGAALTVVLALHWPAAVRRLESTTWQRLGTWSFSLYLIHEPVIITTALVVPASTSVLVVLGLVLSLFAGAAFHRLVEEPSHVLAQHAGRRVAVAATGR